MKFHAPRNPHFVYLCEIKHCSIPSCRIVSPFNGKNGIVFYVDASKMKFRIYGVHLVFFGFVCSFTLQLLVIINKVD